MSFPSIPKSVVITGCSSGIGAAAAIALRERGWAVYPTARKPEDLETLRAQGFTAIELDVSDSDSVKNAAQEVLAVNHGTLGAVINNAGFGQPGALEDINREALRYQYEVNVFGLVEFTNQFVPVFRKQNCGRIIHVSSVVGRISLPFLGAYSSTKFAVEAIADAQRIELRGTGIAVSLVEPGPIITEFRRNAVIKTEEQLDPDRSAHGDMYLQEVKRRRDRQKKPGFINKPPEAVATKFIHALESRSPKRRYCITPPAYFGAFMRRFAPYFLTDKILASRVDKKSRSCCE